MAIDIGSKTLSGQERSFRITRITPASGAYTVLVEREIVYKDGVTIVSQQDAGPGIEFTLPFLLASPAVAAYVVACRAANTIADLIAAEAALYDALVTEWRIANP